MTFDRNPLAISAERNHHVPLASTASPAEPEAESWDLTWFLSILLRRAPLVAKITIGATLVLGGFIFYQDATTKPSYLGQFDMLVEPVTADEQLARQAATAQVEPGQTGEEESQLDYETQIRILRSPKLLRPLLERFQKQAPNRSSEVIEQRFLRSLQIQRLSPGVEEGVTDTAATGVTDDTKIIQVIYTGRTPEEVISVLNELSQLYLRYSLEERKTSIDQAIQFIDEQLPQLRARVNSLQRDLEEFRIRNVLIDPTLEGNQLAQQAGTLEQKRLDSYTELTEARSRYNLLRQGDSISILKEAPEYASLLQALQNVEAEIAAESARVTEENPSLQLLRDRQQNLLQSLNQYANRVLTRAQNQIRLVESRQASLLQSEELVKREIRRLPTAARQYTDIQRELEIATSILNEFTARQKALEIDAAQQNIPWEILNPPYLERDSRGRPLNMSGISKGRFLILAAILSLSLGVGAALLLEIMKDAYYKPEELKRGTKLPILETIPPVKFSDAQSVAFFTEAFRSLATKLTLLESRWPLRSLVVTSSQPQEGKSTIALNLALAAAATGQRVLLVDAALRHPSIHTLLDLPNHQGLTELLSLQIYDFKKVVQRSPNEPKLFILTTGQELQDPTRLLSSEAMQDLAAKLQNTFDLVIYDTSPVMDLADANLVGACANGVILAVELGKANRSSVAQTIETLTLSKLPILGIVANRDQTRKTALAAYPSQGNPVLNEDPIS